MWSPMGQLSGRTRLKISASKTTGNYKAISKDHKKRRWGPSDRMAGPARDVLANEKG